MSRLLVTSMYILSSFSTAFVGCALPEDVPQLSSTAEQRGSAADPSESWAKSSGTDQRSGEGQGRAANKCLKNSLAAPEVQEFFDDAPMPTPLGGSIQDGTYFLMTRMIYSWAGYTPMTHEVLQISGGLVLEVNREKWKEFEEASMQQWTVRGETLERAISECPREPGGVEFHEILKYSATPTQLTLFFEGNWEGTGHALTYIRQ